MVNDRCDGRPSQISGCVRLNKNGFSLTAMNLIPSWKRAWPLCFGYKTLVISWIIVSQIPLLPFLPLPTPHSPPPGMATLSCQSTPIPVNYCHPSTSCRVSFEERPTQAGFAFASIKGEVFLVHTSNELKVYRHEFSSIFRLAHHYATANSTDVKILELIDTQSTRYEEESETVFLAKELTERLRQMTDRRSPSLSRGYYASRRRR